RDVWCGSGGVVRGVQLRVQPPAKIRVRLTRNERSGGAGILPAGERTVDVDEPDPTVSGEGKECVAEVPLECAAGGALVVAEDADRHRRVCRSGGEIRRGVESESGGRRRGRRCVEPERARKGSAEEADRRERTQTENPHGETRRVHSGPRRIGCAASPARAKT